MVTKKKSAKAKLSRPKGNSNKLIPVHIKLTQKEHAALIKRANWWCMGNISAWLRYSGLKYLPKRGENVSQAIAKKKY